MKWLKRVVGPDEFFTVNFHPDGMSLLASPQDDESIIALLRINRESFSLFLVDSDHSWSCSVDLDPLLDILDAAGDDDFVGFFALDDNDDMPLRFKLTLEKPAGLRREMEIQGLNADLWLLDFDIKPREYIVKIAITTSIFLSTLQFFYSLDIETVCIFITDSKVTFTAGAEKKVLQIERNEYVIEFEDVEKEDDSPYVVLFRLKHLRSLNDSIERSNNVCIYPTYLGGPPACLSCTFDSIGEISYFFPPSS
ncbi:hypothetical protein JRO89_XS01G0317200 [Xanthoceras sorbifolium]|uniref:Proliferating cell nuclear antigen n=1 Tax=Xanthoceras sorbifolium TaxID=99658 RepID=A0ABQ8IMI2_9ROSI|nr:hypothetical protein JRO89_XS01G0317200 [Xanthoceras sorbifolium]